MALNAVLLRDGWLVVAAGMSVAYSAGIANWDEGRDLESAFGQPWLEYRAQVRNWLPRLSPYVPVPATFYVAHSCVPCSQLLAWLGRRRPMGLVIVCGGNAAGGYDEPFALRAGGRRTGARGSGSGPGARAHQPGLGDGGCGCCVCPWCGRWCSSSWMPPGWDARGEHSTIDSSMPLAEKPDAEQLARLPTEARNPRSERIDELSTLEMLGVINDEDASVALAVRAALPAIAAGGRCGGGAVCARRAAVFM